MNTRTSPRVCLQTEAGLATLTLNRPEVLNTIDRAMLAELRRAIDLLMRLGTVNVSKLPGLIPGCGGFINVAHAARRLLFCGTFTTGGLKVVAAGGRLCIAQEGRTRKLVTQVGQATFPVRRFLDGRTVRVITERAVFRLDADGLVLEEIAPGVDLERDVLGQMEFRPVPARGGDPALMAADLFTEPRCEETRRHNVRILNEQRGRET